MSLDKNSMKTYVFDDPSFAGQSDPSSARDAFCDRIFSYINSNVVIEFSWVGTHSGDTDPTTSFIATCSGTGIYQLGGQTTPSSAMSYWCVEMSKIITTKLKISAPSGFIMSPTNFKFNPSGLLSISNSGLTTPSGAALKFCEEFIDSFKSQFLNTTPWSGTHGSYTGSATMTSIS